MSTTYKWLRFPREIDVPSGAILEDPNTAFAVYVSDFLFGARTTIDPLPHGEGIFYTWRLQYKRDSLFLYDVEWRFRYANSVETLESRTFDENGFPSSWFDRSYFLGDTYTSSLILDAPFNALSASIGPGQTLPGTVQVRYETKTDGVITSGDLDSSAGDLGIGFDLRDLGIENFRPIEPITNTVDPSKVNTVNFRADVYALPVSTSLFPYGWAPSSDVSYFMQVGAHTDITVEATTPVIATSGLIAEIDLVVDGQIPWDGRDFNKNPLQGLVEIFLSVLADNPDGITDSESDAYSRTLAYVYTCNSSQCIADISYSQRDNQRAANSFGYGWSSEASMKIVEQGNDLFFGMANGNFVRWTLESGDYVPFSPGTYIEVEKDSSHFKLTFKDQTQYLFDVSDGKLIYIIDRNGNTQTYSYDVYGHLSDVYDGNGRVRFYTNRSDGQPEQMVESRIGMSTTHITSYSYYSDADLVSPNRLESIIDGEGNSTFFSYYTDGPLFAVVNPTGEYTVYEYNDEFGRLTNEQFGLNYQREYSYYLEEEPGDGNWEIEIRESSFLEPGSLFRKVYYDRLGRSTYLSELVADSGSFFGTYRFTSYEYYDPEDPENLNDPYPNPYLLTAVTDDNENTELMTYTDYGNIETMTDKAGNVTTYLYSEDIDPLPVNPKLRNLVREIIRPSVTVNGSVVTYDSTILDYDSDGNLIKVTDAAGEETVMTYASDGLVLSVTNRNGNTTEFVYEGLPFNNESRNLLQVKVPKGESTMDGFRTITFVYDQYDNVTSVKDDLNNEVLTTYDDLNRPLTITDALGEVTTFTYADTLLQEVLMPPNNGSGGLNRKTTMSYGEVYETTPTVLLRANEKLTKVERDIDSIGTQQMRVKYNYTGYLQLKSLTRIKNGSEKSYDFTYDKLQRQTSISDSLTPQGVTTMAYEPFCVGNTSTSARGIRRKNSFDSRCLMTQVEVGEVDPGDPLEVLNARELRQWEHDELGRLIRSSQTRSTKYNQSVFGLDLYGTVPEERFYEYNELDRLVKMTFRIDGDPLGANDKFMAWEYDPEGNVTKMTDTDGKVTNYSYFRDNLLKEVIIERSGDPDRIFSYSYDLAGRLLEIEYPTDTEVVAKFDDGTNTPGSGWDAKGQLLHLRYEKDGTLIRRFAFSYDESGNRASQLDVTPTKAIKWEYVYDWLDRLEIVRRAEAVDVASLPGTIPTVSIYSYDESDNRVEFRVEQDDLTYRYVVDDADNLTEVYLTDGSDPEILVEAISVDADGNMLTRTNQQTNEVTTYQWDDFDRLVRVSSAISGVPTSTLKESNRYDVNGIRKRKVDKNGNSSVEYTAGISTAASKAFGSSSSAPSISYIMGHMLMGAEVNGNFQFFLGDSLGSTRDVVDDTGAVIQSYEFQEHGIPMPGSGAASGTFSPKTYQGGLSVNDDRNDSGLYLMGHRHFDSELGRFISRDPIGFKGGLNLFNGAGLNPVTMVDPTGMDATVTLSDGSGTQLGFNHASRLWDYLMRQDPGSVLGFELRGHGNVTTSTMNEGSGKNTQGGIAWYPDTNELMMYWPDPNNPGGFVYRDMKQLSDKGYKFIELHGCNTAGGHPEATAKSAKCKTKAWKDSYFNCSPTESNLARRTSKTFPNTSVIGNAGPSRLGTNNRPEDPMLAPTTYRYVPGQGVTKTQDLTRF